MDTTEIVKALVSPTEKLIDAISGAIGKAYEPKHIRKMAEAKAYELKVISESVRNNSDVPIVYDSTGVSIDTSNYEEIAKRASSRLAYQEITKQQNIEAVADNAYQELENLSVISDKQVNKDWMFRFFNSVENISDEDMQEIWGRILAGEIKQPNSYSYRTLEKLKNLDKKDAEIFQLVSSFALEQGGRNLIIADDELLKKHGIYFAHILSIEECGLINSQRLKLTLNVSSKETVYFKNSELIGMLKGKKEEMEELAINVYVFTKSGSQLIEAICKNPNNDKFIESIKWLQNKYESYVFTAHKINAVTDDEYINYNDSNIL